MSSLFAASSPAPASLPTRNMTTRTLCSLIARRLPSSVPHIFKDASNFAINLQAARGGTTAASSLATPAPGVRNARRSPIFSAFDKRRGSGASSTLPHSRTVSTTTSATSATEVPPSSCFPPPPLLANDAPVWTDGVWASPIDVRRRIFCNRSLNMRSIKSVGWDMDHTLAQYDSKEFESLAYSATVDKMVTYFGYPETLYELKFDHTYMIRGLVIDKLRGNMLKIDRHKYVKVAYHGFTELPREQRMATYNVSGQRHEFDEPQYALIDTLFSLAEAYLFMQLVEMHDRDPNALPPGKQYADLYRDVRAGVDLAHRDGTIKRQVAKDPGKYIHSDPGIIPVLEALRQSGKKIFLATNSLWDYTDCVMNFLISGKVGQARDHEWLRHFDVVITGCGKPRFFTDRKDLFEVHPKTGMLWNTEGGSPMLPIGDDDLPTPLLGSTAPSNLGNQSSDETGSGVHAPARVFQGGSFLDLHKMLGVTAGSEVLYVGDHIYGDVVRSKKALGWRTMLVIPELESELDTLASGQGTMEELKVLRRQRDGLEDQIQRLEWRLAYGGAPAVHAATMDGDDQQQAEEEEKEVRLDAQEADDECEAGAAEVASADAAELRRLASAGERRASNGAHRTDDGCETAVSDEQNSSSSDSASLTSLEDEQTVQELLTNLREQRDALALRHRSLLKAHHESFHPVWGQVFKTGYQQSRYAHQVERFACVYTSHVGNLMFHSPFKRYKGRVDTMAHEEEPGVAVGDDRGSTIAPEWV